MNGAPEKTGAVVGRSSGSPDVVTASGAFAGSYSQNTNNTGAKQSVTIAANASITLPSGNGVTNFWVQRNSGPNYTNYFHGLIEIKQGGFTNSGSINGNFTSLPASTGPLFGWDSFVNGGNPTLSSNYFYGIGVLAWSDNVGVYGNTTINNQSNGVIQSIVSGSGVALGAGVYSMQYYGSASGKNISIQNAGLMHGAVTNQDGTAAGIYHYSLFGGLTVNNAAGATCSALSRYYSSGVWGMSYYGPVTMTNAGTVTATATGGQVGISAGRAYTAAVDLFTYDSGSAAPIDFQNDGEVTSYTTSGNTNYSYGVFLWAEGGPMTFINNGTVNAASTTTSGGRCEAVYCGGNRGKDVVINNGTILGTAGGRGGWGLGVENDTAVPNDLANSIAILNRGTIWHNNGLGVVVFAGTGPALITNLSSGVIYGGLEGIAAENYPGKVIVHNAGSVLAGSTNNNAISLGAGDDEVYLTGLPYVVGLMNGGSGSNILVFQLNGVLQQVNGAAATLGTNLAAYSLGTSGSIVVSGQRYAWSNFRVSGSVASVLPSNGVFTWSAPVPFSGLNATQILTAPAGTFYRAAAFGGQPSARAVTVGGTTFNFTVDGSAASIAGGFGATYNWASGFSGNTGNANFNDVLSYFYYDGGTHLITLKNLIPGETYSVQLFALDNRSGVTGRLSSFQDPNDDSNVSATFAMGDNVYVIGTFTATSTNQVIQQNFPVAGSGNTQAVIVRALTAPEPGLEWVSGSLKVSWPYGTLLQATNLAGPWTTNSGTSPLLVNPALPAQFFRTKLP